MKIEKIILIRAMYSIEHYNLTSFQVLRQYYSRKEYDNSNYNI